MDDIPSECRVVPFGNLWIKGYLHLPRAYRSLSRPSSPPRAKASAMRPCLLSFKLTFKYQVSSIRYYPGILNIAVLKTYGSIYTFSSLLNFTFCTSCQRSFLCFQRWWRITDSNRWPSACKADALASWANPPRGYSRMLFLVFSFWLSLFLLLELGSPRQSWTADLYIISVAL